MVKCQWHARDVAARSGSCMGGSIGCACEGAGGRLPPSVKRSRRPPRVPARSLPPINLRASNALSVTAQARAPLGPKAPPESDASLYPTHAGLGPWVRLARPCGPFASPTRSRPALSRPMSGVASPCSRGACEASRGLLGRLVVWRVSALGGPRGAGVHPSETTSALRYLRALAHPPPRTMRLAVGPVGVVRASPLALLSPRSSCGVASRTPSFASPDDRRIHGGTPPAGARGCRFFWLGGQCFA